MKAKEVFLDFTPLLDVTLIILFYFILFANFSGENTAAAEKLEQAEAMMSAADSEKAEAASEKADAEKMLAEAERMLADAEKLAAEAEDKLEMLEAADADAVALAEALNEWQNGENITVRYLSKGIGTGQYTVTIEKGSSTLASFDENSLSGIYDAMYGILENDEHDCFFIEFYCDDIEIIPKKKLIDMFDDIESEFNTYRKDIKTSKED